MAAQLDDQKVGPSQLPVTAIFT